MQFKKTYILPFFGILFSLIAWLSVAKGTERTVGFGMSFSDLLGDSTDVPKKKKTKRSTYQEKDRYGDSYSDDQSNSPLLLKDPAVIKKDVEIGDDTAGTYHVTEKIGDQDFRPPSEMTFDEFQKYKQQQSSQNYWKNKKDPRMGDTTMGNSRLVPKIVMSPTMDRIFGGNVIDIKPNGNVMLDFGGQFQRVDNPATPVYLQRMGQFIFNQTIQMNVQGKIGEKLKLGINWDTKATFDFENSVKIDYNGLDYEIIKKVDAGNISFPLNSQLIQGSQNLFGAKVEMQFGKLWISAIAANQRGKADELVIQNNAQNKEIEIRADAYEDNRHYFLAQYFRDNYETALKNLPNVNSGITISRVEVYVTNRNNTTDNTRNIIGLMDLGEHNPYDSNNTFVNNISSIITPDNNSNNLYKTVQGNSSVRNVELASSILEGYGIQKVAGYETVKSARKLVQGKDYIVNTQLGYISLSSPLRNDDVLAVSYTYIDNTKVGDAALHLVGETQDQYSSLGNTDAIILKLLRPTTIRVDLPMWNLQMKNVYNINQTNVKAKNFQFRIIYKDDASGVDNPSIHEGVNLANKPLVQVFNLDKLNQNNDPQPDGNFDFLQGKTIDSISGRVYFPVLEPFGQYISDKFEATEVNLKEKYAFTEIYRKTKSDLLNLASKNKFFLRVSSASSSSGDIALPGMNISRGSVQITAGATPLTEGTDYTVNYEQGRIKFLNEGVLASGREIRIRYEKADLFNFRQKSLLGARFDYKYNKDIVLGGTILHLNERPLITRVSIGDEPVSNTIIGLDLTYQKESRTITKLVDKLPLISTKAPSNVTLQGEYAAFIPGSSSLIGSNGTAYVDDFEGAENPFDLTRSPTRWKLGSTPSTLSSAETDNLELGYKRAKLAWYNIDNIFYTDGSKPNNISANDNKFHYVRPVMPQEIYPGRQRQQIQLNEPIFDLAYFPAERGPYNYNPNLNPDGRLKGEAKSNFASVTRAITTDTDFDNANIQYVEFWLMDPFLKESTTGFTGIPIKNKAGDKDSLIYNNTGGKLYINLGSISEDVLKDGSQSFENGLPVENSLASVKNTTWAKVPTQNYINDAFSATSGARTKQDVGLDGVNSTEETSFYQNTFIDKISDTETKNIVLKDPSADDFVHYLDGSHTSKNYKIIDRYKHYNGLENNSPENTGSYTMSSTNTPDNEDLNQNNTINDLEQYLEYEIDLAPNQMRVPNKYIIAKEVSKQNGDSVTWYQFRIPIRDPNAKNIGNLTDLKSIRYLRMYLTGWTHPVVLRMAQFQLVAGSWRAFSPSADLDEKTAEVKPEPINTGFSVSTVNIEENGLGTSTTSGYVVPPGFIRDKDNTSSVSRQLNEQSLRMCVDNLADGRARAVFKNTNFNFMNYGKLQMFIHAESQTISSISPPDTTLRAFVRLGTDFIQNYYEIEIPLHYTRNPTTDAYEIWRPENNLDISFDALSGVKATRNRIASYDQRIAFTKVIDGKNVTIVGNPDLSSVQVMMLGIKNPISKDQQPYSACVWMDEFRVTDFVNNTGQAAVGRANIKLADFANVSLSGRYMGIGFGAIDQKISQRNLNEQIDYGVQTNVSLDKLLPTKAGLRIPLYVSYDKSQSTPKYDPTNPDIKLDASLAAIEDPTKREAMRQILIDQSVKRSINITNLSKVKTGKNPKSHVYDIENVSISASYSDGNRTNYLIAENSTLQYRAGLRYNFSGSPKNYEPFKAVKTKSAYLKPIKDFNLTPMPSMLTFTADVNRTYSKMQNRNSFLGTEGVLPQFQKSFTFNRTYGLNWAFTKSLSLNYGANVLAIIDEDYGDINTTSNKKKVEENLKKGGRTQRFDQTIGINYKLPFDKLPFTDWINADTRYGASYLWQGASLATADSLGNTIANSAEKSVNGKIDLLKLYNKVKFLKDINTPPPPKKPDPKDTTKPAPEYKLVKGLFRKLMTIKSINFTYSLKEGTTVPGFRPKPVYAGFSDQASTDGSYAPGLPFILGSQDATSFLDKAGRNDWISTNPNLSTQMGQNFTENINIRTALEPIKDFKIQLEAKRDRSGTYTETYRFDKSSGEFVHYSPTRSGSYTISFISIKTSFISDNSDNSNDVFKQFVKNREIIKDRLTTLNENSTSANYLSNSQDVLIPAFIAAYTGTDATSASLSSFPKIPLPNWKIEYSGLSTIELVKKYFSNISITHSYTSTYSTGSYASSGKYGTEFIGLNNSELDLPLASKFSESTTGGSAIFNPIYSISAVTIKEAFSPLIAINMNTKKKVTIKLSYNKTRDIGLSISNAQVTELANNEVVMGVGFTKNNFKVPFTKSLVLKNDLTFRFDLRVSDTKTTQRSIEGLNTVTTGNLLISIKPNINYIVNQRLNLQFYFDRTINSPKVSNSFYRTNTLFGIQVRFTLS